VEDVIREIYVDLDLAESAVSCASAGKQIVWGEAVGFRALDSGYALDITWHGQQEAGLLGKAGFDELAAFPPGR